MLLAEKKKKPKTFTRLILHDYKLHPHLYTLASILHKKWFEFKDVHFADLPKQETTTIHMIGQYIAGHRRLYKKADYPAWAESDSTNNDIAKDQDQMQYASELDSAYLLSQTDLLKHIKCKWGQSLPDVMKPTIDDKVRVAMLRFSGGFVPYFDAMGEEDVTIQNMAPNMAPKILDRERALGKYCRVDFIQDDLSIFL
jgi:hypothetical protein